MLCNMNVILYKLLYRKRLLFELYKHLIYRFYLIGKYVPWNFAKSWKQSLGVFCYVHWNLYVSDTKGNALLNLRKLLWNRKGYQIRLKT